MACRVAVPPTSPPGWSDHIFIRRTNARGQIALLGHRWTVDPLWCHRLVRAEVNLAHDAIRCLALRRRTPTEQPLLQVLDYHYPRDDLQR